MVSNTKEQALEAAIEQALTGQCLETLGKGIGEGAAVYAKPHHGFVLGQACDFDKQYAIDKRLFWQFLETTQAMELAKLQQHHPHDWQRKVLERFDRIIKSRGAASAEKGLSVDDAHLTLMYPAPLASSSAEVSQDFAANLFSCTRQVAYSAQNPKQEIDMVLFINGIPLITLELKTTDRPERQLSRPEAVPGGSRYQPTPAALWSLSGAYGGGYRRGLYDHQTGWQGDLLSAL